MPTFMFYNYLKLIYIYIYIQQLVLCGMREIGREIPQIVARHMSFIRMYHVKDRYPSHEKGPTSNAIFARKRDIIWHAMKPS